MSSSGGPGGERPAADPDGDGPRQGVTGSGTGPGAPRLRVRRVPGAPVVGVRAWVPGGARIEPGIDSAGLALLTGRALSEGTGRRDWRAIADDSEAIGASVASSASFEAHGTTVDVRAAHWREGLEWAVELVTEPSFPEDRCRWMARQAASELGSLRDQPEIRTAWAFLEQLHAPHRRALPIQGREESLAELGSEHCRAFHRETLARGGWTITAAGELDEQAVAAYVGELLEARADAVGAQDRVAATGRLLPEAPSPEEGTHGARRAVALPPGDQAHLFVGCLTVDRGDPDRHRLEVLGVILGAGAGLTGRLPERVREHEGLAYSVQVQTLAGAGLDRGRCVIYVGTGPSTVGQAETAVLEELGRLVEEGVSAGEVEDARSYLLGREPFRRETARQWADLLGEAELYGVPEDDPQWRREQLEAVSAEGVTAAARRHLDPEALRVTVGTPSGS